jgi:hypothetical protein
MEVNVQTLTQDIIDQIKARGYTMVGDRFIGKQMPPMYAIVTKAKTFSIVTMMHQDLFCDSFMLKDLV